IVRLYIFSKLLFNKLKQQYSHLPVIKNIEIKQPKFIKFYQEIEAEATDNLLILLKDGYSVSLVSSAGTPLISDPGYLLVKKCFESKIKVESVPGPSAFLTALTSSGLSANQLLFLGFIPKKMSKKDKLFKNLYRLLGNSDLKPTIIFYESPFRLIRTLKTMFKIFGDIEIVVGRELTKIHEHVAKMKISEALNKFEKTKGEFVILFQKMNHE
ncbi:MAG: ribosomal RNA small subunit methyltransferase I, partial [Nitrososphaeraceae archaeon]|nr:ribosomal RNA small subunit methyltransferase I [Nitrososphaeraceae archaeon]